jgi:phosphoglucosamine mutase
VTEISRHGEASLFGTDGIRDRAGEGLLTDAHVERLVSATAHVLTSGAELLEYPPPDARTILVARDTRQSGRALFKILAETFGGYGYVVKDLGVLPTPAVSYLATRWDSVALGVVLSASHNPADYNGIKFFSWTGEKWAAADARRDCRVAPWPWIPRMAPRSGSHPRSFGVLE